MEKVDIFDQEIGSLESRRTLQVQEHRQFLQFRG